MEPIHLYTNIATYKGEPLEPDAVDFIVNLGAEFKQVMRVRAFNLQSWTTSGLSVSVLR